MKKTLFFCAVSMLAQQPPIVVHVNPPGAQIQSPPGLPDLKILTDTQTELAKDPNLNRATVTEPARQIPPIANNITRAPKNYKPKTDVPLDVNSQKSVAISEQYSSRPNYPTEGKDGTVLFTFGAGLPTIVCAPLRLSVIELESGEVLNEKPQASDEVRWDVLAHFIGTEKEKRAVIMIRPREPGLEANLVITTDRRMYYLRLISKPTEYMARVTFQYQNEKSNDAWKEYQVQLAAYDLSHKEEEKSNEPTKKKGDDFCQYQGSGYRFKGNAPFYPSGACDDGLFSKVMLPPLVHTGGSPAFMVMSQDGKKLRPANYDMHGTELIIYQVFERAVLVSGTGKHQQKIEIDSPRYQK